MTFTGPVNVTGPIYIDAGSVAKLELIIAKLDNINTGVGQIMSQESDLDAAIAALLQAQTDAFARIQAKLDALGVTVDLTDETASVNAAAAALSAFQADSPPPADEPPPA